MDWLDLTDELDQWACEGRMASLWWRDDDAIDMTPGLRRTLDMSRQFEAPVHLALIPAKLASGFNRQLEREPYVHVLQHGYSHANHAPRGRYCELGDDRPQDVVKAELVEGNRILKEALAPWLLPVLVPPWNVIGASVISMLPQIGLNALSAAGPRKSRFTEDEVEVQNIHFEPLFWPGGSAQFMGTAAVLGAMIAHLRGRRTGLFDPDEATGFGTHHLQNDDASWAFTERVLEEIANHRAASWIGLKECLRSVDA